MSSLLDRACVRSLNWVARAALLVQGPRQAKRTLDRIASRLPKYATLEQAREGTVTLGARGTCLSRSLAVAARTPGAQIVIAVDPRLGLPLSAHAWVEVGGVRLDAKSEESLEEEIARFA